LESKAKPNPHAGRGKQQGNSAKWRLAEENVFLPARDHIFRQDCLVIDATGQPEVADLEERIK
jgi:hypothetical protein